MKKFFAAALLCLAFFVPIGCMAMDDVCAICLEPVKNSFEPSCRHAYCAGCLDKWFKAQKQEKGLAPTCPTCRTVVSTIELEQLKRAVAKSVQPVLAAGSQVGAASGAPRAPKPAKPSYRPPRPYRAPSYKTPSPPLLFGGGWSVHPLVPFAAFAVTTAVAVYAVYKIHKLIAERDRPFKKQDAPEKRANTPAGARAAA